MDQDQENLGENTLSQTIIDYFGADSLDDENDKDLQEEEEEEGEINKDQNTIQDESTSSSKLVEIIDLNQNVELTLNETNINETNEEVYMAINSTTEQINEENNPEPDDELIAETANRESVDDINVFLMLNNLVNTPNISITPNDKKIGDNETNIPLEQKKVIVTSNNTNNDTQQTNENEIIEQELIEESDSSRIHKRARILKDRPSFESSISSENVTVARFKEVKIIRFFKKVTTLVFKETFNEGDDSAMSCSIESSKKHKELIKEASECRIITEEEANQSRVQPSIQTASNEVELINALKYKNSKKDTIAQPSQIAAKKPSSLSSNRKRTREQDLLVTPKTKNNKKQETISQNVLISSKSSTDSQRITRSMLKPKTLNSKTTRKIKLAPYKRNKRARYDSDRPRSVSSTSSSVLEIEPPVRDSHILTSNENTPKLLKVNLKRLSYENLKYKDLLCKPASGDQTYTVKECSVKLNRIDCSIENSLKISDKVYPKIHSSKPKRRSTTKKSITIREILKPKFKPDEKAFALCTDGNYYPCLVKSYCQNAIYKCVFFHDNGVSHSKTYDVKDNKLISLEQLRENDSIMIYEMENESTPRYVRATICDPVQLNVRIQDSGIRKIIQFNNIALFKENNVEEVIYRFRSTSVSGVSSNDS